MMYKFVEDENGWVNINPVHTSYSFSGKPSQAEVCNWILENKIYLTRDYFLVVSYISSSCELQAFLLSANCSGFNFQAVKGEEILLEGFFRGMNNL